jgi:hypothetical protein
MTELSSFKNKSEQPMNPFRRTIASAIVALTACAPTTHVAQEIQRFFSKP